MEFGQIFRLRTARHYGTADQKMIWADYTPHDKREVFVVVLLGVEPRDGSQPLDIRRAFWELGYVPAPGTVLDIAPTDAADWQSLPVSDPDLIRAVLDAESAVVDPSSEP